MAQLKSFKKVIIESEDRVKLYEVLDEILSNMDKASVVLSFSTEDTNKPSGQLDMFEELEMDELINDRLTISCNNFRLDNHY